METAHPQTSAAEIVNLVARGLALRELITAAAHLNSPGPQPRPIRNTKGGTGDEHTSDRI